MPDYNYYTDAAWRRLQADGYPSSRILRLRGQAGSLADRRIQGQLVRAFHARAMKIVGERGRGCAACGGGMVLDGPAWDIQFLDGDLDAEYRSPHRGLLIHPNCAEPVPDAEAQAAVEAAERPW